MPVPLASHRPSWITSKPGKLSLLGSKPGSSRENWDVIGRINHLKCYRKPRNFEVFAILKGYIPNQSKAYAAYAAWEKCQTSAMTFWFHRASTWQPPAFYGLKEFHSPRPLYTSWKWCPRLPSINIYNKFISDVCGLRSPLQLVATPCCWLLCGSRGPEIKPKNVNQELARLCPSLCIYTYILHTIWNTIHMYIYIYIYIPHNA